MNIYTHKTASGADYYSINPKGNVPALVVGDVLLNEGAAVLQWIADQGMYAGPLNTITSRDIMFSCQWWAHEWSTQSCHHVMLVWLAPNSGLAPANGTIERYQLQNHLNYIASEVHASHGPLFNPNITPEAREAQVKKLYTKFMIFKVNWLYHKLLKIM